MMLVIVLAVRLGIEAISRTAIILVAGGVVATATSTLILLPEVSTDYLFPIFPLDEGDLIRSAIFHASLADFLVVVPFLLPYTHANGQDSQALPRAADRARGDRRGDAPRYWGTQLPRIGQRKLRVPRPRSPGSFARFSNGSTHSYSPDGPSWVTCGFRLCLCRRSSPLRRRLASRITGPSQFLWASLSCVLLDRL